MRLEVLHSYRSRDLSYEAGQVIALGRGADPLLGIPYAVLLMLGLYALAHVVMTRTVLGPSSPSRTCSAKAKRPPRPTGFSSSTALVSVRL